MVKLLKFWTYGLFLPMNWKVLFGLPILWFNRRPFFKHYAFLPNKNLYERLKLGFKNIDLTSVKNCVKTPEKIRFLYNGFRIYSPKFKLSKLFRVLVEFRQNDVFRALPPISSYCVDRDLRVVLADPSCLLCKYRMTGPISFMALIHKSCKNVF